MTDRPTTLLCCRKEEPSSVKVEELTEKNVYTAPDIGQDMSSPKKVT